MEQVETVYPGVSGACCGDCKAGRTLPARAHVCVGAVFCRPGVGGNPHHCYESRVKRSSLKYVARAGTRAEQKPAFWPSPLRALVVRLDAALLRGCKMECFCAALRDADHFFV